MKRYTFTHLLTVLVLLQGAVSQQSSNSTASQEPPKVDAGEVPEDLKQYIDEVPHDSISGRPNWLDIAEPKRAERETVLPQEWRIPRPDGNVPFGTRELVLSSGMLTPEELDLTNTARYDLTETARRIAAEEVTSEQVVIAFCKRATAATSLANSLTEVNFTGAINRVRELDHIFNETGETSGLAANSISILFGRTINAHNSKLGAGGSTGGEGAAIATSSSLLGIGSDGAGSCRMPAHANGVIGYRASGYRLPDGSAINGWTQGRSGLTMTGPVAGSGFFAHSVRNLRLVAKLTADANTSETGNIFLYPTTWIGIEASKNLSEMILGAWQLDTDTFIT